MSHGPSLTVTNKTSLAELQRFSSQIGDTARLRGRPVDLPGGGKGIELYAKDSKPGLWSRLTGAASSKRGDAREAVSTVLRNHERSFGGKNLDNVRTALNIGIRSKDVKGEALKVLVHASDRAIQLSGKDRIHANRNPGPGLEKLPSEMGQELVRAVNDLCENASCSNASSKIDIFSKKLGIIFDKYSQNTESKDLLQKLFLSSGSALKFDLREAGDPNKTVNPAWLSKTLDDAILANESKLIPNKQVEEDKIKINGEMYKKDSFIAEGGFGIVNKYVSISNPSRTIALKIMKQEKDENDDAIVDQSKIQEFKRETKTHISAFGTGNENIVGCHGAVEMLDGSLALALDLAPNGTVESAAIKINTALGNGQITDAQAKAMKLTLIKDMAEGLGHLRRAGVEMIHNDFKPLNVLVGETGTAMIADFGLSAKARHVDGANINIPDVAHQLAPELYTARDIIKAAESSIAFTEKSKTNLEATADLIADRFKGLGDESRKLLLADANHGERVADLRKLAPDAQKAEIWSFGTAAFEVIFNRPVAGVIAGGKVSGVQTELRIANFNGQAIDTSRPDNPASWQHATTGAFAGSSGDPAIDAFLNAILVANPNARPDIATIAGNAVLNRPDVGSQTTRELLASLTA